MPPYRVLGSRSHRSFDLGFKALGRSEENPMSYPITAIDDINPETAKALKSAGIRTTEKLLEAAKSPKGRKELAARTELNEKVLLRWANIADKLRIKGMGKEYATLLREVGVDTVKELRYRNPARLAKCMAEANKKRKLVRFLPSEKLVRRWVEDAKKLPQKISY
jgi:predicted RecB family nuclease